MQKATDQQIIDTYRATKNVWKAGKMLGMCGQSVHERCKKLGIIESVFFTSTEKAAISELYKNGFVVGDGKLNELAARLNRPKTNICRWAKTQGLTSYHRPVSCNMLNIMSVRTKKYIALNGHPKGALGMKHTEDAKRRMGINQKISWGKKTEEEKSAKTIKMLKTKEANGTMVMPRQKCTWKQSWREVGGAKKYYRSLWEANYARYLEFLKSAGEIKSWEHEPKTFWFEQIKRGCRSYLPDFLVVYHSGVEEYHEVKGWMDDRSKTKLKRMSKYYPSVRVVLIQAAEYKKIKQALSGVIEGWE